MKFNGFNGQRRRQEVFDLLLKNTRFGLLIETGTCNGETAGYMAQTSKMEVSTCELDPKWHAIAVERLKGERIGIMLSDSRYMLSRFVDQQYYVHRTFFYLDAHWNEELPLAEEVEIIASSWKDFVILIDDFKVPDDPGYGYDDYGGEKVIALPLIQASIDRYRLGVFFPTARSNEETGARRGSCWLASPGQMTNTLSETAGLRRFISP